LLKVLVEDPLEVPRSLVIKIGRESDGEGRSWTFPVYIFNSDMVNAGSADEEDPPANNGDPHPFHGPVVPGEPDFVAHIADQFLENLPQQAPDQESNINSVTQQDDSATAPLFVQGQNQSAEVQMEEDQDDPMLIENPGAKEGTSVDGPLNQETVVMTQRLGVSGNEQQSDAADKNLEQTLQLVVKDTEQNPKIMPNEKFPGLPSLIQHICSAAQI
jgi:hypothetical protein